MSDLIISYKLKANEIYDKRILDNPELPFNDRMKKFIDRIECETDALLKIKLYELLGKDFTPEAVEKFKLNYSQQKKRDKAIDKIKLLTSQTNDYIQNNDISSAFKILEEIENLKNEYRDNKKVPSFNEFLVKKRDQDANRTGEYLGYKLNKFNQLCKNIDGLQAGFYLISAFSNVGKTAFSCNLALDAIQSNPDVNVIYFSLDDSRSIITNRMLSILSGIPINKVQRDITLDVDKAYQFLADSNLDIIDSEEIQNITQLESKIRIAYKGNEKLIIFIDGLYNLDVESKSSMIRDLNIERANHIKRIVDIYQLPVIMTGEILKSKDKGKPSLSDVMESGKYVYNSNLILMLYDKTELNQSDKSEPLLNIGLVYAKNKLTHFKGERTLVFKSNYSLFEEIQKDELCNKKKIKGESWLDEMK